jgi:HSP20 family protein
MTRDNKDSACNIATRTPRVDIIEAPESFVIEAELPGVTEETLEIDVERGVLSLRSRLPREGDRATERPDYARSFRLGEDVDPDGITAKLNDGLLQVTLPKSESVQKRRIAIELE